MLIISSCKKDEIKIDPNNLLIGTWNYSDYQDNAMVYIRSGKFIDNRGYKLFLRQDSAGEADKEQSGGRF